MARDPNTYRGARRERRRRDKAAWPDTQKAVAAETAASLRKRLAELMERKKFIEAVEKEVPNV